MQFYFSLKYFWIAASILSTVASEPVLASTECTVTLSRMYAGDGGNVWLHFTNGGSAILLPSYPDIQATTAFGMTALLSGRTLTVRFTADGVLCNSFGRSDIIGVYLNGVGQ
jgi:hypothetical protein